MKDLKVKNITQNKTKLLRLKLLKTKVYKNKNEFTSFKIEDIEYRLKKALHIVYQYHTNNKRILFVGTPLYDHRNLNLLVQNTRHILIPESIWVNGVISNQSACFHRLSKNQNYANKKIFKLLFQLKKRIDLVVILNQTSNPMALKESYYNRIPVISLNSNLNILDMKPTYKIPGNFNFTKKKSRDNFFYSILNATLKKAERGKTVRQKPNLSFDNLFDPEESSRKKSKKYFK